MAEAAGSNPAEPTVLEDISAIFRVFLELFLKKFLKNYVQVLHPVLPVLNRYARHLPGP
jgi:hypothetical protein